ncbi:cytochrome C assembly family protein [Aidingimonas lacisalsi]|uniref:cytochrome C assembly family protein n=1 Tax=Aidingimonas lacisalsi TaxID=2604086 RepID=UPI0011D2AC24|nr:cytochrome c biogenesis protein CcsA [Aidingimonas lacisalsi]
MQALPFALLAIILYLGATTWQGLALVRRVSQRPILVRSLGLLALSCHVLVITSTIVEHGGLRLDLASSVVFASGVVVFLLLLVSLMLPLLNVSVALFPLAAASLLLIADMHDPVPGHGLTPGIALHAISSVLAFAVLIIAAGQAMLLGLQNQALRHHHTVGIVQALPPLTTMERALFKLIWGGLALLTLSIISGFLFVDNLFAQHLAHKTILSLAAWAIFSLLLAGHHWLGWRGLTAVRWTLGGFVLLLLAYFGSKFALEIIFQRS